MSEESSALVPVQAPATSTGRRNLIILTIVMIILPIITVVVSLIYYDLSGDKYLDRSRPGFMPDKPDDSDDANKPVDKFSEDGPNNQEVLDEYLERLRNRTQPVLDGKFFQEDPLSDNSLLRPMNDTDTDD